jgi:biotin operon repressor
MAHRVTKIAAATTAATALVAGGYALGTSGNGTAAARPGERSGPGHYGWRGRPARMQALSTLATKLGVSEAALRSALKELRPQRRADRRDAHVAELAKALGISEAKVRAALDRLRAQRGQRPGAHRMRPGAHGARIAALAKALGVHEADVRSAIAQAFQARRQDRQQRRDAFATALAAKLGIDPAKAKAALADFAAQRPMGGWRRGPGWHRGHP